MDLSSSESFSKVKLTVKGTSSKQMGLTIMENFLITRQMIKMAFINPPLPVLSTKDQLLITSLMVKAGKEETITNSKGPMRKDRK